MPSVPLCFILRSACCFGTALVVLSASFSTSQRAYQQIAYAADQAPHLNHPDAVCQSCHREIYDRYQKTSMAQGSGLAVDGLDQPQLAAKDLTHIPSGVRYHVSVRDGQAYLSYNRPATPQRYGLDGERRLDYFIGSGRRGRTYLYQIDNLWFEAPINWYGKKQLWDMAPAFDDSRTMPAPLPVDSNCLHCHAGDVQAAEGPARNRYSGQPFQDKGIGCAACHGDPAEHLAQMALEGKQSSAARRARPLNTAIINPSKLDPVRRDSICLQCHLEGDAAIYLPGKSLQAFRPGEDLFSIVTYFVDASRAQLGARASSQYEALIRSTCKRAAGDRLTCTTCHDPHSSPTPSERVAFYRGRCLACHTTSAMLNHHSEQQDCTACHMPRRKTTDISHEQLTDHDIEARPNRMLPDRSSLIASRISKLVPIGRFDGSNRELGLAYAQLAQRGDRAAGERALALLKQAKEDGESDSEVLDQLGFLLQVSGSTSMAEEAYRSALRSVPQDTTASANLAVIEAISGRTEKAVDHLAQVVQNDPSQTPAGLNLAFLECTAGRKATAQQILARILLYNPDSIAAREFKEKGIYQNQICAVR